MFKEAGFLSLSIDNPFFDVNKAMGLRGSEELPAKKKNSFTVCSN